MSTVATTATTVPQALHPRANTTINTTIVQLVLDRLTQPDALHAAQVSKDWLATVQHHLLRATLRSPAALEQVSTHFANLEHLTLHNVKGDSIDFKHIARLKHLQSLTLGAKDVYDPDCKITGLEALASMPTLSHLTLCHMVLDPSSGLSHVVCKAAAFQEPSGKNKGALLELTLHACYAEATLGELLLGEVYEAGWSTRYTNRMELLQALKPVSSGPESASNYAGHPPNACQLQVLDLTRLRTGSRCVYKGMGKVTTLQTLVMRHVENLDDDACLEVAKLTGLHSLDIAKQIVQGSVVKVSHRGIEALCSLPNLESLVLQGCGNLSNTTANLLCNLHASLTHLDLRQSSGEGHRNVARGRKLISIEEFPGDLHAQPLDNQAASDAAVRGNMPVGMQPHPQQVLSTLQQQVQEIHELLQDHERHGKAELQRQKQVVQDWLQAEEQPGQGRERFVEQLELLLLEDQNREVWAHKDSEREDMKCLLHGHKERLQGMQQLLDHQGNTWLKHQLRRIREWAQEEQREQQARVWTQHWDRGDAQSLYEQRHVQQQQERERLMFESRYGKFTSASVQRIVEGLPRLQSLVLSSDAVDHDTCRAISRALPALTALKFINCQELDDDALYLLESLTRLRTLSLVNCKEVTDTGVTCILEACRLLQHVRLAYTPKVTSLSIVYALHGLPLVSLDLSGSNSLNDEVLNRLLAACPLLELLVLDNCHNITDIGVCAVAKHPLQLRHLSVQYCSDITVGGLCALAALPRLACVHAYGCITSTVGLKLPGVEVVLQQPPWWST